MFELTPFERRTRSLFDYLDSLDRAYSTASAAAAASPFKTDIIETDTGYQLQAELPGFRKEDIKIDLGNDRLTIKAEHTQSTEEKKQGSYLRRERSYGSYARSFDITGIEESAITASYENGILILNLPRKAAPVPVSRQIEIH